MSIALYGVAAMAGPKTPRELADRMLDQRAQHRAHEGFVRETFTQPRDDARQTVREFLDRYPQPAYMSEVEHWRELSGGEIEITMRRRRTAIGKGGTPTAERRTGHDESAAHSRSGREH